jgi:hypothetical protein
MLTKMGYHNSGNQLLYNGFTGEQIYSEIFIGPTYVKESLTIFSKYPFKNKKPELSLLIVCPSNLRVSFKVVAP